MKYANNIVCEYRVYVYELHYSTIILKPVHHSSNALNSMMKAFAWPGDSINRLLVFTILSYH